MLAERADHFEVPFQGASFFLDHHRGRCPTAIVLKPFESGAEAPHSPAVAGLPRHSLRTQISRSVWSAVPIHRDRFRSSDLELAFEISVQLNGVGRFPRLRWIRPSA